MRKRFFPMRSLQIILADVVTQKRQLKSTLSDDNSSGGSGSRGLIELPLSTSNLRCECLASRYLAEECRVARMTVVTFAATYIRDRRPRRAEAQRGQSRS